MIVRDCDIGGTWEGVENALGQRSDQAIWWVRVALTRSVDDVSTPSELGARLAWGLTMLKVTVGRHGRDRSQGAEPGKKKDRSMHSEGKKGK